MAYKSIDSVGVRQLRNRLNNLRDYVNDNELNRNIEQVNPNEAEEKNEQLNLDRLQDRNDEVIFPAVPMDNHEHLKNIFNSMRQQTPKNIIIARFVFENWIIKTMNVRLAKKKKIRTLSNCL
ncbi:Protein of unknown function [Cotesia congregata]|uniref:Uncharacterized protein n=1 Tax=Cotesia congregata TaxID=51543 RepID=A0A8J2H5Q2_COTCN|nr:Protein of unknown function [Cotesia congregata]